MAGWDQGPTPLLHVTGTENAQFVAKLITNTKPRFFTSVFLLLLAWSCLAMIIGPLLFAILDLSLQLIHGHIHALVQVLAVLFGPERLFSKPQIQLAAKDEAFIVMVGGLSHFNRKRGLRQVADKLYDRLEPHFHIILDRVGQFDIGALERGNLHRIRY